MGGILPDIEYKAANPFLESRVPVLATQLKKCLASCDSRHKSLNFRLVL